MKGQTRRESNPIGVSGLKFGTNESPRQHWRAKAPKAHHAAPTELGDSLAMALLWSFKLARHERKIDHVRRLDANFPGLLDGRQRSPSCLNLSR
jgi:hypothetical protein